MRVVASLSTPRSGRALDEFSCDLSAEEAIQVLSVRGHTLCEYLCESQSTRLFLDRDLYLDGEPDDFTSYRDEVVARCNEIGSMLRMPDYAIASRHGWKGGRFKVSFRVFFKGFTVVYHDIPVLIRFMEQDGFWDTSPYKRSEQLLACINGQKGGGDDRVLVAEEGHALLDFTAQHVVDDWPHLDLAGFEAHQETQMPRETPELDGDTVRALVALLSPKRATDRKTWVDVGIALRRCGDEYFDVFCEFSRRATDPSAIASDRELARQWSSFARGDRAAPLTVRSLVHWARHDDPEGFRRMDRLPPFAFVDGWLSEAHVLINRIKQLVPGVPLDRDAVPEYAAGGITVKQNGVVCEIDPRTFALRVDGEYKGMLCGRDVPINTQLASVHRKIKPSYNTYVLNRDEHDKAVLQSVSEGIKMDLHNPFTDTAVLEVAIDHPTREGFQVDSRNKLKILHETLLKALREHGERELKGCINLFNNCTIVVNNNFAQDDDKKDDEQIAQMIIASDPEFFQRWRFVPDRKTQSCNGIYFCSEEDNIWRQLPNSFMEKLLLDRLPEDKFTRPELRHIRSRRGTSDMLYCVARSCMDLDFAKKLNADLNWFVLDNRIVDTRTMEMRPIAPEDYVIRTAGWSYDPELAAKHRDAVESFFEQLIPVDDERHAALAYFASLLSGYRAKKLLMLTDKRSGENGKTQLTLSVGGVFGGFAVRDKDFLNASTIQRDRNSHQAGKQNMQFVRLLVCEELSSDTKLDMAFVKDVTCGGATVHQGRGFDSGDMFRMVWEAGIVVSFNQGCLPKIGNGEEDPQAFWKRVIVVPMRSRFEDVVPEDSEAYTFKKDVDIHKNYDSWRSAILDVLMRHWDPDLINGVGAGDSSWAVQLATSHNPLKEWLEPRIRVTRDKKDYTLRDAVVEVFVAGNPDCRMRLNEVKKRVEEYLRTVAVKYISTPTSVSEGIKRYVARGVVFSEP